MINKEIFSINAVLSNGKVCDIFCGDPKKSFLKGIEKSKEVHCTKIKKKAEIVVAITHYPTNKNLYQSQKALENAKLALKNGGILILVVSCNEGIGEKSFFDLLSKFEKPKELVEYAKNNYVFGYYKVVKIAQLAMNSKIFIVSSLGKVVEKCFMKSFESLEKALKEARREVKGREILIKNASFVVPIVKK